MILAGIPGPWYLIRLQNCCGKIPSPAQLDLKLDTTFKICKDKIIFIWSKQSLVFNMERIKNSFAQCKKEQRSALIPYVTAGYPTISETVDILLGMENGGAGMSERCMLMLHVLIVRRSYRTRPSIYRSHRRWANDSKSKYASIEERCHDNIDFRNSPRGQKARSKSSRVIYGLL